MSLWLTLLPPAGTAARECSRSESSRHALSMPRAYVICPTCLPSAVSCSAMRPFGSWRPSSRLPWPRICGGAGAARWATAGTWMRHISSGTGAGAISYRAIDRNGNLVDVLFSEHRDRAQAPRCSSCSAQAVIRHHAGPGTRHPPRPRTATPGRSAPSLGKRVRHQTSCLLEATGWSRNTTAGTKGRYLVHAGAPNAPDQHPGFAVAYDVPRNFLRLRSRHHQHVPADRQRLLHLREESVTVLAILQAA